MKKLALRLDDLSVESFDATPVLGNGLGTVEARQDGPSASCMTDICGFACSGDWCQGQSTTVCIAGTYEGRTCDSTCFQRMCTCTHDFATACDWTCSTCVGECPTDVGCPTQPGFQGC